MSLNSSANSVCLMEREGRILYSAGKQPSRQLFLFHLFSTAFSIFPGLKVMNQIRAQLLSAHQNDANVGNIRQFHLLGLCAKLHICMCKNRLGYF